MKVKELIEQLSKLPQDLPTMSEVFGPNGENPLTSPAVAFGKFLQEELKGDKAPITRPAQAESVVQWMSEDERHIYRNRKIGETMAEAAERLDKEKGEIKAGRASVTRPLKLVEDVAYPHTQLINSALVGQMGPSQQRIAQVGLDWIATLIKKNTDYGDSAWTEPVLAPNLPPKQAILVRMSDKINRLKSLSQKEALVDESYNDTMKDLGAYALLYLAAPETDE
jgi:hypothetical protein